jgi:hypothetical protein
MRPRILRPLYRVAGNTLWTSSGLMPHFRLHCGSYERIYLYHVRKTAGTSVAFAFMRLSGVDPHLIERRISRYTFAQARGYRYVGYNITLIRQGGYFFSFCHEPDYAIEVPANTFRLTVLRDPISRVVSLYRYLATPWADSAFSLKAPHAERRWAMEGFDRFLDQAPLSHIANQLHMFSASGSVGEAVDRLSKLDMVLRTEQLDQDLRRLEEALHLQLPLTKERTSLLPFAPTSVQRERLQNLLADEYEMLRQIRLS